VSAAPVIRTETGRFPPNVSGNPSGRPKLTEEQREALTILNAATPKAAKKLVKLIRSLDDRVALQAALALLNRVLGKEPAKADDSAAPQAHLSAAAALAIVKAANGADSH
jgi:hypothetical protein